MTQTISHLPNWVIALFFGLIYLGYSQTKTREVSKARLTVLPLIMLSLSLYGVVHAPNSIGFALLAWAAGLGLAFAINSTLPHGIGVVAHAHNDSFIVPGSWVPLMLLMSVFIAKFSLGFLVGSHAVDPQSLSFILISSSVSGLISGTFLARAAQIFATGLRSTQSPSTSIEGA